MTTSKSTFDDILTETEETFRKGLSDLGQWSEQAKEVLEKSPGTIMTALTLAGFVTGIFLRQKTPRFGKASLPLRADPLVLFAAGTVAGLLFGPRFLNEEAQLHSIQGEKH